MRSRHKKTPTHDVIESDEHDLLDASPYVDSESDNECRRPTPNGLKYWFPDVPVEEKPTEGDVFDNFDEAYNMYLEYSQKARFPIRKFTTKRKNGNITHKYILCSKAGKPRKTIVKDTLVQDNQKEVDQNEGAKRSQKNRYSSFTVTDCKAAVRKKHVLNFSFEYKTVNDELSRMFWANETMKCNYSAFGDVVSFDSNYRKSVTFGAGLLSDETLHSYTWLLTAFKQAHGKEPLMAVTDQDTALRNAIEFVFPDHHRLCMWHITQKIPRKVVINELDGSITCSCNHFRRYGYLCRHVFCVLHINSIDIIPERYISKRWRKDVLPRHLLEKRHKYRTCIEETDQLASDIHTTMEYCFNHLRNDTEKLTKFLAKKLLGVTTPNEVVVKVSKGIRNKGCGTGGARFIGPGEKAKNKAKTKQQGRSCSICFETVHNMRTCKRNKSNETCFLLLVSESMSFPINTQGILNKGCGYTGPHEKATRKAKGNPKGRLCGICHQVGHNARTCPLKKNKGNEINVDAFQAEE
nr:protein FAR1-related sequence 5-like [Tanacetum cinerariifolium]